MRNFILRLFINAVALWAAAELLDGVVLSDAFLDILWVALVFGLVNALIKPVLLLFSFPLLFITLGLFVLVINALLLLLTGALTDALMVEGFGSALLGSLIISIVAMILNGFLQDPKKG